MIGGPKGAATKLGLKRTTLIHKMQELGIPILSPTLARHDEARHAKAGLAVASAVAPIVGRFSNNPRYVNRLGPQTKLLLQ